MKLILCCILLSALAGLCAGGMLNGAKEAKEDWRPLHYKIFNNDEPPNTFEETLGILKTLKAMYEGLDDEATKERMIRVQSLLDVANVQEDKCYLEYFTVFLANVIRFFAIYQNNVIPFVKHYKQKQYIICEPKFSVTFNKKLTALTEQQQTDLDFMINTLDRIENGFSDDEHMDPLSSRRHAVLAYLELTYGPQDLEIMFAGGMASFRSMFEETVLNKCTPLYNSLKEVAQFYETLMLYHANLKSLMNDTKKHWLHAYKRCKFMIEDASSFIRSAYMENHKEKPEKISLRKRAMLFLYPKEYRDRVRQNARLLH